MAPCGDNTGKLCSLLSDADRQVNGGARRIRTDDILLAKQALSQLSYGPISKKMVGPGRLELPTSRLSGVRSNHLSYGPSGNTPEVHTGRLFEPLGLRLA